MKPLDRLRELVTAGFYRISKSARVGMRAHGIPTSDVLNLLLEAEEYETQDDGAWKFEGVASSIDAEICVVVHVEAQVAVISAHLIVERGL